MGSTGKKDVFDEVIEIRFRGTYDYDGLLQLIRAYYDRHLFVRKEPKFKFKTRGTGSEVEFKMYADRKITHYVKVFLYVEGHLWDVKQEEVVLEGKKVRRTNGKLELKLSSHFEFDYAKKFATHGSKSADKLQNSIEKWMQDVLDTPDTGLQFGDTKVAGKKYMEKLLVALGDEIKKFLKMECF
jgi:hypothetical protein